MHPPFTEDCQRGQWWFKDAEGARRCLAKGLMLPSVCIMDTEHGPVQLDVIDRELAACSQQTGVFPMDERFRGGESYESFQPFHPTHVWVGCGRWDLRGSGTPPWIVAVKIWIVRQQA